MSTLTSSFYISSYGEVFLNFFLMVKRNVYATLLLHNFQRISNVLTEELLTVTSQCLFTDSIVVGFAVKFKLGVIRHDYLSVHYHHKYSVTSTLSRRRYGLLQDTTAIISSLLGYCTQVPTRLRGNKQVSNTFSLPHVSYRSERELIPYQRSHFPLYQKTVHETINFNVPTTFRSFQVHESQKRGVPAELG